MSKDRSKLQCNHQPMPKLKDALQEAKVMDDYKQHPVYQQNDYLDWTNHTVTDKTKAFIIK